MLARPTCVYIYVHCITDMGKPLSTTYLYIYVHCITDMGKPLSTTCV